MGTQLTIGQLIADIRSGELILPEFQRGYVWSKTQVREYLDSLYRGYPTGSFLIWKTPNPGITRGGEPDEGTAVFQLILDGQQRLTSVFSLVTGEPPPFYEGEHLYFDIYFNVKTEEFSYFKSSQMKGVPEWLPVTRFLQHGLGNYLSAEGPLDPEERDFLFNFFEKLKRLDDLKTYSYYLDTLGQQEIDEVVRIFNLVNSKGTRLTKADLALSHICALWPEARQILLAFQKENEEAGFKFGLEFYVRCLASVATGAGAYEPLYRVPIDDIKKAWSRTSKALSHLFNVLRLDAFIDSAFDLVSDTVLVPLVVFLSSNNSRFSSEKEKRSFLHWMYAALMWGRYGGAAETKLQQDLEALKKEDPQTHLRENIIADRGRIRLEARDLLSASTQSAYSHMAYVVARAAGAVDWFNGLQLYGKLIGKSNGLEYHHIFPQSLLYRKGGFDSKSVADRQRVNEIANIAYLTQDANRFVGSKAPSDYLSGVQKAYPSALRQQQVPQNSALWTLERFDDFLAERRALLADAINDFMDELLEEQQPHFAIEDYIAQGEGENVEFKGSLRWDFVEQRNNPLLEKSVAKTLAAFMNSKGGTLIVGVGDKGEALGLEHDFKLLGSKQSADGWELTLRNALNTYLSKEVAALVDVTFGEFQDHPIAVLRAEPARRPVYLSEGNNSEFYVRSGNTSQRLDVKQANEYCSHRFPPIS